MLIAIRTQIQDNISLYPKLYHNNVQRMLSLTSNTGKKYKRDESYREMQDHPILSPVNLDSLNAKRPIGETLPDHLVASWKVRQNLNSKVSISGEVSS